jgi:hypothetical protein
MFKWVCWKGWTKNEIHCSPSEIGKLSNRRKKKKNFEKKSLEWVEEQKNKSAQIKLLNKKPLQLSKVIPKIWKDKEIFFRNRQQ